MRNSAKFCLRVGKIYTLHRNLITNMVYLEETHEYSDLCKFYISGVAKNSAIWIFVSCIINQLMIPHPIIVFSISTLWKYCYRRPRTLYIYMSEKSKNMIERVEFLQETYFSFYNILSRYFYFTGGTKIISKLSSFFYNKKVYTILIR